MATQDAILDAAEELFASQGYAATSIKDIGQAAGANPALLYYYFRDKTGLYRAVLARIGDELVRPGKQAIAEAPDATSLVRGIVAAQAGFIRDHPRAVALIIRELVDHQAAHCEPLLHRIAAELFRPLVAAIEAGQADGTFRPDLDARFTAISIVAQNIYFRLAQPIVRILLNKSADFPRVADLKRFGEHAADFAIAALAR